ncbi:hypothetical protein LOK49_LG03G00702 [Camellia lanceoleosa]|uniref:Uncharacterized protein n=1 Tax=Camellia lanceoleosa TaxID=1840588 RepID=A0ACC0ICJ4_9ERIC|nr:hypothetical protein LOK49_LG03G00702 [Camellia lanceoleosa]
MVTEWQEAYMNYNHLKTHLKEIQRFKLRHKPPPPPPTSLKRKLTLYRAFSGLTQRIASPRSPSTSSDIENQAIVVQWSDGGDRLFGFITLHMLMYAGNIYYWRQYRVNYSFMFGFKEGTELGYREVLLLSFGVALLALASVHANLDMEIDPKTQDYKAITELVPMGLLVVGE